MLQMSSAKMKAMKYGYARVSTDDQTPALQLAALKKPDAKEKDMGIHWNSPGLVQSAGFRIFISWTNALLNMQREMKKATPKSGPFLCI
jgi:hypothetical protein